MKTYLTWSMFLDLNIEIFLVGFLLWEKNSFLKRICYGQEHTVPTFHHKSLQANIFRLIRAKTSSGLFSFLKELLVKCLFTVEPNQDWFLWVFSHSSLLSPLLHHRNTDQNFGGFCQENTQQSFIYLNDISTIETVQNLNKQ